MIKRTLWLLAIMLLCSGGWYAYFLSTPVALPVTPFEFDVKSGTTMKGVAQQLAQAGMVKQAFAFTLLARLTGKGSALKAGNYALNSPVTPWELLQKLTKGDVSQSEVKFIEGWNFKQLRQVLNSAPNLQHDTRGMSDTEIMAKLGWPNQHPEGRFFPDTYFLVAV